MDSAEQDRRVWYGGSVKLLLRCLQSIQCQYYLVFGVVKTVPMQSFARLRAFPLFRPFTPFIAALLQKTNASMAFFFFFATQTAQQHGERSSIHIYILHLLSLRSSLITYIARARARFTLCGSPSFTYPSSFLPLIKVKVSRSWIKLLSKDQQLRNKLLYVIVCIPNVLSFDPQEICFFIAIYSIIIPSETSW